MSVRSCGPQSRFPQLWRNLNRICACRDSGNPKVFYSMTSTAHGPYSNRDRHLSSNQHESHTQDLQTTASQKWSLFPSHSLKPTTQLDRHLLQQLHTTTFRRSGMMDISPSRPAYKEVAGSPTIEHRIQKASSSGQLKWYVLQPIFLIFSMY